MCAQLNACALLIPAGFCCGILDQLRTSAGPRALGAGGSGGRLLATAVAAELSSCDAGRGGGGATVANRNLFPADRLAVTGNG